MSYVITQDIIPGLPKEPYRKGASAYEGVVAHSTATPEATCEKEMIYFKREWKNRQAFPHFFVDWSSIVQCADTDYKAWAAGKGNPRYVHVELCETKDPVKFQESYKRYVWLLAFLLKKKNLGVTSGGTLVSHAWVSQNLGGTDHMDPIAYLQSHGITWTQLVMDVKEAYENKKNGWFKENSIWFFYKDGKKTVSQWVKDKDKWYYVNEKGEMQTGYIFVKDKLYFLDRTGAMLGEGSYVVKITKDGVILEPAPV